MNYKILSATVFLFTLIGASAFAQSSTTSAAALIEQLKQQITNLNIQIAELQKQLNAVKEAEQQIKETSLQLKTQLKEGMSSEDVKLLQEFLASDPEIYPEGKITGYFGWLTRKAVERFQKKACISTVGNVGPQTLRRINELLTEGAGKSGHIPEGLLRAFGIQKKLCSTSTSDVIAPVISVVSTTNISTSTARITWKTNELSDSKVYYSNLTPVSVSATSTSNVTDASLVKNHSLDLMGLTSTTTYYYFVVSKDSSGNTATSSESSFVTTEKAKKEQACAISGGTIKTSLCCISASDFPNLCLIGACGCSPTNSHQVKTCDCGEGKCFNGEQCVAIGG